MWEWWRYLDERIVENGLKMMEELLPIIRKSMTQSEVSHIIQDAPVMRIPILGVQEDLQADCLKQVIEFFYTQDDKYCMFSHSDSLQNLAIDAVFMIPLNG